MNYRIFARSIGRVLLLEAAAFIVMMIVGLCYREDPMPFLLAIGVTLAVSLPLSFIKPKTDRFSSISGFVTVAVIWIVFSLFGALPFFFCGQFGTFADCVFESVSGFTTTGSTILADIEALPHGILLWRSMTHFLGGMGILVLVSAFFPSLGEGSFHLMQAEVPGPTSDKLVPKLAKSSKILYCIYVGLTVSEMIALLIAGMDFFGAVNIALATAGTGGFAITNASLASYSSAAIEIVTAVFMLLFSLNFTLYFMILSGGIKQIFKDSEFRFFTLFFIGTLAALMINTYPIYKSVFQTFRYCFFTVTAISSTTGFMSADFDQWPEFSKALILMAMVIGGCAGSTAGGMKASRVLMIIKTTIREIRQIIHPNAVTIVRMNGHAVSEKTITSAMRFFMAYFLLLITGTVVLSLEGYDVLTCLTSVLTALSNVGPGLNLVGPTCNFSFYSAPAKYLLSVFMLIGRLEIFPILVLFSPAAWRRS